MRKAQKKQIEELLALLEQAHDEIRGCIERGEITKGMDLLAQCQESAVQIGELIEKTEGEGIPTIPKLEVYCEMVYETFDILSRGEEINPAKTCKRLKKSLIQIENSVKNDIEIRLEIVFLPYKASMWDSLESVWRAADADSKCDAYVVPIPYYDKNRDGTLGTYHYEGDMFPTDVPVVYYGEYRLEERKPDAVFIHNPYDNMNFVTSVEPRFYSFELKKHTECLVYIPYYAISGNMSEAQSSCMAYYFADYIIIQAEKYRKFYDPDLPKEKLVPLGSPKFDKVIRLCQNPPDAPKDWEEKMKGRKVFFYNTSINGMLGDTKAFLRKMEYVLRCFAKCENACLLWRPHPLLESAFDSMRAEYKPVYDKLKQYFVANNLGIYDDTPEIEPTIALCDAYIGDGATSVTALFSAAGKPLFLLNNRIDSEPQKEDWRGGVLPGFSPYGNSRYIVTSGGALFYDADGNCQYKYACRLCEYQSIYGGYYLSYVVSVLGKDFVCPGNAQEILLLEQGKIAKRIGLERYLEQPGAFYAAVACGKYLLLLPNKYPALVRYDTVTGKICYFREGLDHFSDEAAGERRFGGYCVWKDYLFLASPVNSYVSAIHVPTGKMQMMTTKAESVCGCVFMIAHGEELWLLPYEGYTITRWNPKSGEMREYDCRIDGLQCKHPVYGYTCDTAPFGLPAFLGNVLYLPPSWGNLYLRLDTDTGEVSVQEPFCEWKQREASCYYPPSGDAAMFFKTSEDEAEEVWHLFTFTDKRLYEINLLAGDWREQPFHFQAEDQQKLAVGFDRTSEWSMYASCEEDAFHTLADFLQGTLPGRPFDPERAGCEFAQIAANSDGTCGEKVFQFISGKLKG